MSSETEGPTRRSLLVGGASVLALSATGCAALPDLVRRGGGRHPCDMRFCRYWVAPRSGRTSGSCSLPVRARGGP